MRWAVRILNNMPNLKHITLHREIISFNMYGRETLHLISQIDGLESLTLSQSSVQYGPALQSEFNLVLPNLKLLRVIGTRVRLLHILEQYPGVSDKLETLKIGVLGDARVLQVHITHDFITQ